jgi:hypothetical protein
MAHPVDDHLGHRAAAFERLEPGFIIDGLGHAQQGPPTIERVRVGQVERPRRQHRRRAERHRRVDHPRLIARGAILDQMLAGRRINQ